MMSELVLQYLYFYSILIACISDCSSTATKRDLIDYPDFGLTGWTGVFRLVRAEYMKHTAREYVLAAKAIGVSNMRRIFVHIFPECQPYRFGSNVHSCSGLYQVRSDSELLRLWRTDWGSVMG